jgi:enamine deaminase RidA (YjgF/YER057c/UK114 family)
LPNIKNNIISPSTYLSKMVCILLAGKRTSILTSKCSCFSTLLEKASQRINSVCVASSKHRQVHVEANLEKLGIVLPPPPTPAANYNITCYANNNMLYVSGHIPFSLHGKETVLLTGAVGEGAKTLEEGKVAARACGLNIISTLKRELGDLDRVEQVVKIFGIVNSTTDFKMQHRVLDGCSDLMMEVFGKPVGYHARSAIGTNTLPLDITVEVEAIVQIKK